MRRICFCLPFFVFLSLHAKAETAQQSFFKRFESRRLEFPGADSKFAQDNPGRYPAFLRWTYEHILDWSPVGVRPLYTNSCDPQIWGERLSDARVQDVQLQGAVIQKYFQSCANELKTGTTSSLLNSFKMMTMKLDFRNHPFMHRVVFHLPGSIHLKALLALKGDRRPRPLVVVRLGVFGSAEEILAERSLLLQMFEQSPFNALILESMSSADFVADNERFSFGGYDEGLQNILIAQMLRDKDEPLSRLVQSLHFVGASLGGHGVLFASLLNELNGQPIQSFLGLCPVVNLKPSLENLTGGLFAQKIANFWSSVRLQTLRKKSEALAQASSFDFMPQVRDVIQKNYHGGLSFMPSIKLPAGMMDSSDFWKLNEFWSTYQNVSAPVLILSTEQDPIVPFQMNSAGLKRKNIKVVSFPEGIHCSFGIPYKWDAFVTILQSYVLSHSPSFVLHQEKISMDVSDERFKQPFGRLAFAVSWPHKKDKFVRIEIENFQLNLPAGDFDFHFFNDTMSAAEKQMLERWLYQNLRVDLQQAGGKKTLLVSWPKAG